jgi:predicted helicase
VIIGNPPYNAWQMNENDNNKNRIYKQLDKRVQETYIKGSTATNRSALSDPYVKAFRWASDRLKDEGIVAFVTNNGFIDGIAFDGMRQHLAQDFDAVYVLDLGGNVRKNPKLSGTTHNVFGIQVGVSITFLIRRKATDTTRKGIVHYARMDEYWRRTQKYSGLESATHWGGITWQTIIPSSKHLWLTEGMQDDYETLLPLGTKAAKQGKGQAVFKLYVNGVKTNRDIWVYNFQSEALETRIPNFIDFYNEHVFRYSRANPKPNLDEFVNNDDKRIKWSRDLKTDLKRGKFVEFQSSHVRAALYRPFTKTYLYFDNILNQDIAQLPRIFPTSATEAENRMICLTAVGNNLPFHCIMTNVIPDLHLTGDSQCFPLYVYDAEGAGYERRDNISDWALSQFQTHYGDTSITKQDIFYYIYALLHHPEYRSKYAQNLKRELPRVGFVGADRNAFVSLVGAGMALAYLHLGYENVPWNALTERENKNVPVSYRVEKKMALSKDKSTLKVNEFLTLEGIPAEAFSYKLGNRSALEWVIEQYQVSTDKRSGISNDPNRLDDERYIVRLVSQVVYVSLETMKLVNQIAAIDLSSNPK